VGTGAELTGRTALVTGASRGLGRAIAGAFRAAGAELLLVARSDDGLRAAAAELRADGRPAVVHTLAADLADPAAPARVAAEAARLWRRLDVLVNNAAVAGPIGPLAGSDPAVWEHAVRVNLLSVVDLCRCCLPRMGRGGRVVNLSGGGATEARPNFTAYATAKAGLVRFSETLAAELAPAGITVNCVAPGPLDTDMQQDIRDAGPDRAGSREYERSLAQAGTGDAPLRRAAALCVLLASDAAAGVTGRLVSAVWDPWPDLPARAADLAVTDIYTLRRVTPAERGRDWPGPA
jgi:NAD(P)-dependent dehydrogenase (short-subunit alcohol dehydrogenase family)